MDMTFEPPLRWADLGTGKVQIRIPLHDTKAHNVKFAHDGRSLSIAFETPSRSYQVSNLLLFGNIDPVLSSWCHSKASIVVTMQKRTGIVHGDGHHNEKLSAVSAEDRDWPRLTRSSGTCPHIKVDWDAWGSSPAAMMVDEDNDSAQTRMKAQGASNKGGDFSTRTTFDRKVFEREMAKLNELDQMRTHMAVRRNSMHRKAQLLVAAKRAYIELFNLAMLLGFVMVLLFVIVSIAEHGNFFIACVRFYASAAATLTLFLQAVGLLEIIHAVVQLTKGSVFGAVLLQLGRDIVLLVLMSSAARDASDLVSLPSFAKLAGDEPNEALADGSLLLLFVVWALGDALRYGAIFAKTSRNLMLSQRLAPALLWWRYTAWMVLFPIGFVAEMRLLWIAMGILQKRVTYPFFLLCGSIVYGLLAYGIGAPFLLSMMWRKRRAYMKKRHCGSGALVKEGVIKKTQ